MIRTRHIAALALALTPALALASTGDTVEVAAEGVGADKAAACADARKRGLRDAVEQVAGVYLGSDTLVKDSVLVSDQILTRAEGFVSGFKVLSEKTQGVLGSATAVECALKLSVTVEKRELADEAKKIAAAFAARGRPKVLLMVAEQSQGVVKAWWDKKGGETAVVRSTDLRSFETRMIQTMMADGWRFLDPEVLSGKIVLKAPSTVDPTNEQLREFGRLAEADVVIFGKVYVDESDQDRAATNESYVSFSMRGALRAVATDSGDQLGQVTLPLKDRPLSAGGLSRTTALGNVFTKGADVAAKELGRAVIDRWVRESFGTQDVKVRGTGIPSFAVYNQILTAMRGFPPVKGVENPTFGGNELKFDVKSEGMAEVIAGPLSELTLSGYTIQIDKLTANTLEFSVKEAAVRKGGKK